MKHPTRVLIIDDNEAILNDFVKILMPEGTKVSLSALENDLFEETVYEPDQAQDNIIVTTANQGELGAKLFEEALSVSPFDIAFIDMRMPPGWDGLQTMRRIWELNADQFIVLCTAYSDHTFASLRQEFGDKTNFLILRKPFDRNEVLQIVNSVSARYSANERKTQEIARNLLLAINNDEIKVRFQPIVDIKNNKIAGFETLCRWIKDGKTFENTETLIQIAEDYELIEEIGYWVAEQSFIAAAELERIPGFNQTYITVNASPLQLKANFLEAITELAKKYKVMPGRIGIEVTESRLVKQGDEALEILQQIKDRGFNVFLDDFGAGFSSLNLLSKIPCDVIKIDRAFCMDVVDNKATEAIISSILLLAQNLGKKCVIEGAETKEQVLKLNQLGAQYIQGFYFSKPVEFVEALQLSVPRMMQSLKIAS